MQSALDYAVENDSRFLAELSALCTIPSISSLPEHKADMLRAAEMLAGHLRLMGLHSVDVLPTAGHPVVWAEWLEAGPQQPTVLFYGHYDVQPALDLAAWRSDPFSPTEIGEHLFGRGTSDMKGQVMAELAAVQSWLSAEGRLPVNVKFLLEGEEEIGSKNLREFIKDNPQRLACDIVFNPDAGMAAPDLPSTSYSLRGGLRVDLAFYGPSQDVHSGTFGGALLNPAQALAEFIAGLHDRSGRVSLPGFYDGVLPLTPDERSELARLPFDEAFFIEQTGVPALWGEPEYSPYERTTARPTLEVLAFHAGLPGEGVLNIVPAKATAALSMRLVPDQDPQAIYQALLAYMEASVPKAVRWEAKFISGGRASLVDRQHPAILAWREAQRQVWGVEPVFMRVGGGITAVAQLREELNIASLLTGFSFNDDNAHGPNEHLHLPTWRKGIQAIIRFLAYMDTGKA
jgi:acetylornithine deacetylase/succinyl-diaminopimelate desuccinylase-like protein